MYSGVLQKRPRIKVKFWDDIRVDTVHPKGVYVSFLSGNNPMLIKSNATDGYDLKIKNWYEGWPLALIGANTQANKRQRTE
jgi:hypothetical protein